MYTASLNIDFVCSFAELMEVLSQSKSTCAISQGSPDLEIHTLQAVGDGPPLWQLFSFSLGGKSPSGPILHEFIQSVSFSWKSKTSSVIPKPFLRQKVCLIPVISLLRRNCSHNSQILFRLLRGSLDRLVLRNSSFKHGFSHFFRCYTDKKKGNITLPRFVCGIFDY